MVHMKNIICLDGVITCLYSPENCGEYGYIQYNSNTKSLEVKKTTYDININFYSNAVKHKLVHMLSMEKILSQYFLYMY